MPTFSKRQRFTVSPFEPAMNCVSGPDRDVGVPERQPFEVVVVGRLDVEQVEVAAAVEDHLAVAGAP